MWLEARSLFRWGSLGSVHKLLHVFPWLNSSLLFSAESYPTVWVCQFIYPFTTETAGRSSGFSSYEWSCEASILCAGLCVDVSSQLILVNTKDCDEAGSHDKSLFSLVRNQPAVLKAAAHQQWARAPVAPHLAWYWVVSALDFGQSRDLQRYLVILICIPWWHVMWNTLHVLMRHLYALREGCQGPFDLF